MKSWKPMVMGGVLAAMSALTLGSARAAVVTSLIGDKDGFGLGIAPNAVFDWSLVGAGDGDGTDVWRFGAQNWTHTYVLPAGAVAAASLEIFHGGDGSTGSGPATVSIDGTGIGNLTIAFDFGVFSNAARLDVLDLSSVLGALDGSTPITVTVDAGDGWVLDYSELRITTRDIPEPSMLALVGIALAGLGLRRYGARKEIA